MKKILFSLIIAVSISACKKAPEDRYITKENLKQDFEELKEANPDMDSLKIRMIKSFVDLLDGRQAYLETLAEGDEENMKLYDDFLVGEEEFNSVVDTIFKVFKEDKLTYKMLFAELDSMQEFSENFMNEQLMPLYRQVEEECQRRQKLADFIASANEQQLDSLLNTDIDFSFLVVGKDTITASDLQTSMNYDYKTPDELFGFCPYISNREPLAVEIRRLKAEREKYVKSNFALFNKYNQSYSRLFK